MSAQPQRPQPVQTPTPERYDAGDVEHVRQAKKKAEIEGDLRRAGLAHSLSTPGGRAWVYNLLEFTGVFRTSFTGNSETFMREGQRNIGLMVLADLMRDHEELYLTMCREAKARGLKGFRAKTLKDDEKDSLNAA